MSAAAVIVMRRKRLVKRFQEAGAIDRNHATTLESLGERPSWIFNQMVERGVFKAAELDHCFLDEHAAVAFLQRQRKQAVAFLGIMTLLLLLLWLVELLAH